MLEILRDIVLGLRRYELWSTLGWRDVMNRYRRAALGFLWIPLSMAVVAGALGSLQTLFNGVKSTGKKPVYLSIGDDGETELATGVCREMSVSFVDAGTLGVNELVGFLRQFPAAISGRHHINIFLMRAGVPFLPLPSNTWKIEETLKLVGYPFPSLQYYGELPPALNRLLDMREKSD